MKLILLLIQRYGSKSPKLFSLITKLAIATLVICQGLLLIEARLDLAWLDERWSGLLNDIVFLSIGIALPSAATTEDKELQDKTKKLF